MSTESHKNPRVRDDPAVREVYANKLVSASFEGGPIVLTFGATRLVPERVNEQPQPGTVPDVYVTGRLAISPPVAIELINSLQGLLAIASQTPIVTATPAPIMPMPAAGKAN